MATITIKLKDTLTLNSELEFDNVEIITDFVTIYEINIGSNPPSLIVLDGILPSGDGYYDSIYDGGTWTDESCRYMTLDLSYGNNQAFITAMKDNIEGVLLESGTYKWVDEPNVNVNFASGVSLSFTSNGITNISSFSLLCVGYVDDGPFADYGICYNNDNITNNWAYKLTGNKWTNEECKTITTSTDQYVDYDFYNYAILGNQLVKQTQPAYSFKHWKKSNVKVNKTGNLYFKPYTILGLYAITTTLTSCQASPTNVDRIEENSSVTLYFSKITSSYVLPDSVEVTNATYTWDKDTGALALSNPTGDVSITITAVEALPQLATPTNVAVTDTTLTFDEVENATSYEVFVDNVSIGTYESGVTIKSKTDTQFIIENGSGVLGSPITITSKKATSQVSIDLTSLSGWNNVSDGEHNIQVVAKADNYRDSEKSTAVSFTKGSGGKTLTSSSIAPNNIEVNGTALTSLPYTLQNGDTIQVTYTLDDSAITVNGVKQTSNYQTYNLSNTDIIVEAVDGNIEFPRVTINYTA